mmetsp:Transcript_116770/g.183622  ORF Transcript_116770/g.183622 Transcript_116770/m.183622 type:complete len:475 (-) Transcript_116770:104-1528(-)
MFPCAARRWRPAVFRDNTSDALLVLMTALANAGDVPSHKMFADSLTAKLYSNDNECSSALGVSMCFGLVYPGADGDCAQQIKSTLRFPDTATQTALVWGPTTDRIMKAYDGKCTSESGGTCLAKNPTIEIANSVWMNGGDTGTEYKMTSEYMNIVGNVSQSIDFKAANAASLVNAWCSEKTHGLIPTILNEGPIDGDLVAVNAIYLNATWLNTFEESKTNEDAFYINSDRTQARASKAHFMHMVEDLPYVGLNKFQLLQLPYTASSLSMLIALPRHSDETVVSSADVLDAVHSGSLKSTRMAVSLPKFRFESTFSDSLELALKALGMVRPFEGGFFGLLENKELFVSSIIQKTFINVFEKGTEAAAVTALQMKITSVPTQEPDPILFMADHPFQFWIYDSSEDVVLFEGRVGDPGIVDGSSSNSQKVHKDSDFWEAGFNTQAKLDGRTADSEASTCTLTLVSFASVFFVAGMSL